MLYWIREEDDGDLRGRAMNDKSSLEEIQTLEKEIAIKLNEIHISKTELDTLAETHKESLQKISAKLREDLARLRDLHQQLGFKLELLGARN